MKNISIIICLLSLFACNNKKEPELIVKTNIRGLKKGTVYLKQVIDTSMTIMDSVTINGESLLELHTEINEPDMFYLFLDKNSTNEDYISFFADKGITEINTTLKNFVFDAKIKGSKHQKVYEEYKKVISNFNTRNLNLIKEKFEAHKKKDSTKINSIKELSDKNLKRKYLYTVNFALNNKDSELAPYLTLTEIYNAKIDLLDTINKSLSPHVKASKYGKKLDNYIKEIKLKKNNSN